MTETMKEYVARVLNRYEKGEKLGDLIMEVKKELPKSWKTVLFHVQRLLGHFDKHD